MKNNPIINLIIGKKKKKKDRGSAQECKTEEGARQFEWLTKVVSDGCDAEENF